MELARKSLVDLLSVVKYWWKRSEGGCGYNSVDGGDGRLAATRAN